MSEVVYFTDEEWKALRLSMPSGRWYDMQKAALVAGVDGVAIHDGKIIRLGRPR
jgi:hypothetical protein